MPFLCLWALNSADTAAMREELSGALVGNLRSFSCTERNPEGPVHWLALYFSMGNIFSLPFLPWKSFPMYCWFIKIIIKPCSEGIVVSLWFTVSYHLTFLHHDKTVLFFFLSSKLEWEPWWEWKCTMCPNLSCSETIQLTPFLSSLVRQNRLSVRAEKIILAWRRVS